MNCLKNYILSRSCENNGKVPRSGLYIEQLEGISIQNIADTDDGKYGSAKAFIQDKIDFAAQIVLEDARQFLNEELSTSETSEAAVIGAFQRDLGYYASEAVEKGLYIEKRFAPMGKVQLDKLVLLVKNDISNKKIIITDGITKEEIFVDLVGGVPLTVDVSFQGATDFLTVKWDTSDIEPAASSVRKSITNGFCGYCDGIEAPLYVQGINGTYKGFGSYGIQAHIQLKCDLKQAFCQMIDDLKFAILYKAGILILKEWQSSTRLNYITIHSEDWLELKLTEWEELTYPEKLKQGLQNASTYLSKLDSRCFQKEGWKYAETIG